MDQKQRVSRDSYVLSHVSARLPPMKIITLVLYICSRPYESTPCSSLVLVVLTVRASAQDKRWRKPEAEGGRISTGP